MYRHHAWVSFEAVAEAYNEVVRITNNHNARCLQSFLKEHPLLQTGCSLQLRLWTWTE